MMDCSFKTAILAPETIEEEDEEEEKQSLEDLFVIDTGSGNSHCRPAPPKKQLSLHDSTACATLEDSYHIRISDAEDDDLELGGGEQQQGGNKDRRKKRMTRKGCLYRSCAIVVFVLVVVAASVLLEPVIWQGSAVSPYYYEQIIEKFEDSLSEETMERIEEDENSPQAKAYEWIMEDPGFYDYPNWRQRQRFAVAVIYFALNGPSWSDQKDWLSHDKSECEWQHYTNSPCRKGTDVLERLILSQVDLEQGSLLPPETSLLFALQEISIVDTTSVIPFPSFLPWQDLANINSLNKLDFSSASLQGSIPPTIGLLTSLEQVILSNSQAGTGPGLTGAIPSEVGQLESLQQLDLAGNSLTGTIPEELSFVSGVKRIRLQDNQLQGSVPEAFCSMPDLVELRLDNNQLEGAIPGCFQSLSNLRFTYDGNQLLIP